MPDGLVVVAPLRWEARTVGRKLPAGTVIRTGMGPARSARALPALRVRRPAALAVAGFAGALTDELAPGDVVVATESRGAGDTVVCLNAPVLVDALRADGLRVHLGPVVTVDHVVHGRERAELATTGALAVDMESAVLAKAADGKPLAVVRVIVDTPSRRLVRPGIVRAGFIATAALARVGPALLAWAATNENVRFPFPKEVHR